MLSMGIITLNATEINAIFWTKGKQIPVKVEVTLADSWYIQASKDVSKAGDYLISKKKSAYMLFNIYERANNTAETYANIQTRNGFTKHTMGDKQIFTKEILKDRRRVDIGRFISTPKKVSLSTTLSLYDNYLDKNIDKELEEALLIMASAKIISFPDTSNIINPKIASTKKSIDDGLLKVQHYAENGDSDRFPATCVFADSHLIKYTYPNAPKEIYDYYANATTLCYGKIHAQALHAKLKKEGNSACRLMEVTLQITHIKKHVEKTNDLPIWNNFMDDYKKICPNHNNTGY